MIVVESYQLVIGVFAELCSYKAINVFESETEDCG